MLLLQLCCDCCSLLYRVWHNNDNKLKPSTGNQYKSAIFPLLYKFSMNYRLYSKQKALFFLLLSLSLSFFLSHSLFIYFFVDFFYCFFFCYCKLQLNCTRNLNKHEMRSLLQGLDKQRGSLRYKFYYTVTRELQILVFCFYIAQH